MSYCATNKYARSICADNQFWLNKFNAEMGDIANQYITQYSHPDTLGIHLYKRWTSISFDIQSLKSYMKNGYNDIIIYMLECLEECVPSKYAMELALENDNIELIEWLISQGTIPLNLSHAVHNIKLLDWLETKGYVLDPHEVEYAYELGNTELVQWFEKRGIFPSTYNANYAAQTNNIQMLEEFERKGWLPTQNVLSQVAYNGHLDTLRWLLPRGIILNDTHAISAVYMGHIHVINWFMQINPKFKPTDSILGLTARDGHLTMLRFFRK